MAERTPGTADRNILRMKYSEKGKSEEGSDLMTLKSNFQFEETSSCEEYTHI